MKREVVAHKSPKSPISEIFRTLRTNIQFMDTNKKMKSLLITSTSSSEGKSWVTSNLAVTFAQAGKKVIIIDADMRKGRQYAIFEVSPKPGLSNFLAQAEINENGISNERIEDYIQETEVDNLKIITAGNVPPNPSELLVSQQMIYLMEELKKLCDIVIIDGTPCELVTDSVILSRIVDATVITVAHKSTKKDELDRTIKNIQNVGGNIIGVVLNKEKMVAKRYGEYYYYGNANSKTKKNNTVDTKHKAKKQSTLNKTSNVIMQDRTKKDEVKIPIEEKKTNVIELEEAKIEDSKETVTSTDALDKTNEILKQINEYLDNEKKKLNN